MKEFSAIILAGGRGTRMNSELPKVLHQIAGEPMLERTIEIVEQTQPKQIIVVVGHGAKQVIENIGKKVDYALQEEQLGTANALQAGLKMLSGEAELVLVLNGDDSAFYKAKTIKDVLATHEQKTNVLTFVSLEPQDPTGLGRVLRKDGKVERIVEEKDATDDQRKIKEVNDGLYVFERSWLEENLPKIEKSKATGEYYLVEAINIAISQGEKIDAYKLKDPSEWHGINTPEELQSANFKIKEK